MKNRIISNLIFLLLAVIISINSIPFFSGLFIFNCRAENVEESTEVFFYTADERRDPFISLINKSGNFKDNVPSAREELNNLIEIIKVDGILWDEQQPLAMINNEIHKIGDVINKLTVKNITDESVTFGYADLTHTITIVEKKDY